jgi:cyclohexadieny/prephenate dehydrogenase
MNTRGIRKVAILGVGFMGGSLGLALQEIFPKWEVWGYARSTKSYNKLKKLKVLNQVDRDYRKVVRDADLVVLALPVEVIVDYLKKISPFLKRGSIIFDLGSSKKLIEKGAHKYLPASVSFVGCHPLCGSEKSGAQFGRKNLYEDSICLVTSSPKASATKIVEGLWKKLGSKVVFINPEHHDKVLSSVSHLPHLISFSLTECTPSYYLKFASGSFRDLTRISGSPADIWGQIFISNKKNILKDLDRFIKALKRYEALLKKGNEAKIIDLIKRANSKQKRII